MDERILVTGGTGLLGREVVNRLIDKEKAVRIISRRERPATDTRSLEWTVANLQSGEGLDQALGDVTTVVHCATAYAPGKEQVLVKNLVEQAKTKHVQHFIYVSIVGVDRIPYFYYNGKVASEKLIEESGIPFSILRATQFHDLVREVLAVAVKLPIMLVPNLRVQPIDVRDVAQRLVDLSLDSPQGRTHDLGGPHIHTVAELAEIYTKAIGRQRRIHAFNLPGKAFRGFSEGHHIAQDGPFGEISFTQYLAERPEPASTSYRPKPT